MYSARQIQDERETSRWLPLAALALLLVLAMVGRTLGGPFKATDPPGLLPTNAAEEARPMNAISRDLDSRITARSDTPRAADVGDALWKILEYHGADDPQRALDGWREICLPETIVTWRHVAMAVAELKQGHLDAASDHLSTARDAGPDNAVVHYYTGLLRLMQAEYQPDWNDAEADTGTRFVAYRPQQVVPNSASMYRLVGAMHLERAIELADRVPLDQIVAPTGWTMVMATPPTVGDLLTALGAERFEASSHNVLGGVYFERGAWERAEGHMDSATDGGADVMNGYRDLARQYEQDGRYLDAARAYAKEMRENPGKAVPAKKLLENLGRSLFQ